MNDPTDPHALPMKPTGHFDLWVRLGDALVEEMHDANLIVDQWRSIQANALGGTAGYPVSQIGVGTSGAAPAGGNTALGTPFLKAFDSVLYPASNQVQFNFSLGTGDANGMGIQEFGLMTTSGLLYARKVRATVLNKTALMTLSGSWTITF